MLQAIDLGEPGRTDLWTAGTCSMGNQTYCRQYGAEYACVGCDFPQGDQIKLLQKTLNEAASILGIRYQVKIDGQVGQRTAYLVGVLGSKMAPVISQSPAVEAAVGIAKTACASDDACTQNAIRQVGVSVPALLAYFSLASANTPPGTELPVPGQPPTLPAPPPLVSMTPRGKVAAGFLGGLMFLAAGVGIGFATRSKPGKRRR